MVRYTPNPNKRKYILKRINVINKYPKKKRKKVTVATFPTTVAAYNRSFVPPRVSMLYNPQYSTKLTRVFRGFRARKNYNFNAKVVKDRVGLTAVSTLKQNDVNFVFTLDKTISEPGWPSADADGMTIANDTLYPDKILYNDKIQDMTANMEFIDSTGQDQKSCVIMKGLMLRCCINANSYTPNYITLMVVKDKYQIFPGFCPGTVDNTDQKTYGGFKYEILDPKKNRSNKYETNFYVDYNDPHKVMNFNECQQQLRCATKINPYRYTTVWRKTYKLANNKTTSNMHKTNILLHQYIPYRKKLIYDHGKKEPKNDKLVLMAFMSVAPGPHYQQDKGCVICYVKGHCNMLFASNLEKG